MRLLLENLGNTCSILILLIQTDSKEKANGNNFYILRSKVKIMILMEISQWLNVKNNYNLISL